MDNLYEMIKKADSGDVEAQFEVAWHIVGENENEPIEPDWLERAVDYYERAAAQGYGDAMLDLGAMYRVGRGVARDINKAFYWFNQAAAILHPKAFRCLGYALEIPLGYLDANDAADSEGYKMAFKFFFKGAMLYEQNSIYKLGDMFLTGKFVDIDAVFAFSLYEESYDIIEYIEDDSYASVCLRLGECYCKGLGTEQDLDEAHSYLQMALDGFEVRKQRGDDPKWFMEGYNRAKLLLKRIRANKIDTLLADSTEPKENQKYIEFIDSDMMQYPAPKIPVRELEVLNTENPKIAEFDNCSFSETLAAAESGDKEAMYMIAFYCFNRFANEPDNKSITDFSLYYFHKAIRHGHKGAMYNLASIYYHGNNGVQIDRQKAYCLYLYSEVRIAQGELGVYYAKGENVEQDYEKAFLCFAKCALLKINACYGSMSNLARMYREGIYVDIDKKFSDYLETLSNKAEAGVTEVEE
jgi:TPR repeat protein